MGFWGGVRLLDDMGFSRDGGGGGGSGVEL